MLVGKESVDVCLCAGAVDHLLISKFLWRIRIFLWYVVFTNTVQMYLSIVLSKFTHFIYIYIYYCVGNCV